MKAKIPHSSFYRSVLIANLILILTIVLLSVGFFDYVKNEIWESSIESIMESAERSTNNIATHIDLERRFSNRQIVYLKNINSTDSVQLESLMRDISTGRTRHILVVNGKLYPQNSNFQTDLCMNYLQIGTHGIIPPHISKYSGKRVIGLSSAVPLKDGITATMLKEIPLEELNKDLAVTYHHDQGFSYLINRNGDIVFRTAHVDANKTSENFFEMLGSEKGNSLSDINSLRELIANNELGWATLNYQDVQYVYIVLPVDNTDWYMVAVLPVSAITQQLTDIFAITFGLILIILVAICLLSGTLLYREHRYAVEREQELTSEKELILTATAETNNLILAADLEHDTYKILYCHNDYDFDENLYPTFTSFIASRAELAGEGWGQRILDRFNVEALQNRFKLLGERRTYLETKSIINGEVHWIGLELVLLDKMRAIYSSCIIDDAKEEEEKRRKVLTHALQAAEQASAAKTGILNNVSHDIRTPMNAILAYTSMARTHIDNKEQTADYLGKIHVASEHLLALINDMLDMSRIESGRAHINEEPVHLPDMFANLQNIMQADADERKLDMTVDAGDISEEYVFCDRMRLAQILMNLTSNAIKFTPEGGKVNVTLKQTNSLTVPDGYAEYAIHVRDTGIGISPEFIEHIYEPFVREENETVQKTPGTGLGMSITKSIVDMMGGTIDIDTEQGKGTEVVLTLSFRIDAEGATRQPVQAAPALIPDFRGKKILLVEDNELNQEIAVLILEDEGFEVTTADNGAIAVDIIKEAPADAYDAILMDIQMPCLNGYEATKAIRALDTPLAHIPILAMTADAFEEDRRRSREAGMNGHLVKPINISEMLSELAKVMKM